MQTSLNTYTRNHAILSVETGNGDEFEVELFHAPCDWMDMHTEQIGDKLVVAYLVHDDSPPNPLEDCDGMGAIHHHPRSRYGSRDSDYYEILGLDSYGDPVIDEDKVQMMWRDKVLAIAPERFIPPEGFEEELFEPCPIYSSKGNPEPYWEHFRLRLADEHAGDYDLEMMARYAWRRMDVSEELINALFSQIEPYITWGWNDVSEKCRVSPDIDAVLLDRYEHGLCSYLVHSNGGCPWDTSRGEAVWVPDKVLREELEKITDPEARWKQAVEWAQQACKEYTNWCNGDCYGCVVEVFQRNEDGSWDQVEEESCWGFIGSEWAEEALKDEFFQPTIENIKHAQHQP